jgi:hypothetical protein
MSHIIKKQDIKKRLYDDISYELLIDRTLRSAAQDLIKLAEQYEAEGYTNITLDYDYFTDDDRKMVVYGTRLETDTEARERADQEILRQKVRREHDLKTFKAAAERLGIKIEIL